MVVEIFTKNGCPYCVRAQRMLEKRRVRFQAVNITNDLDAQETIFARAGGVRTLPQIFLGNDHLGGCDDLYAIPRADFMAKMKAADALIAS